MIRSTIVIAKSFSVLAIVCALAATDARPAAAQTAKNLVCKGCVSSKDIKKKGVTAKNLAPGLILGQSVWVRSNGSAAANCSALRKALAKIKAGAKAPGLIRLEAGTYNCGTAPLALKSYVAIEGAGPGATTILGNVDGSANNDGVINGADNASLGRLTVRHQATGTPPAIGISTGPGHMNVRDVAIEIASTASNTILGIRSDGTVLDLSNVSVQTSSTGGGQGISARSGADLHMTGVWVSNSSAAGNPAAIQLFDSDATGFGVLFSSNTFGVLGFGSSTFELFGGTVIGGRGTGGGFNGSFTCVGVAKGDFTARGADCS